MVRDVGPAHPKIATIKKTLNKKSAKGDTNFARSPWT